MNFKLATYCRLSGESLLQADPLITLPTCPLPGIYPLSKEESLFLRSPLQVIQAPRSGFVQLAHVLDSELYGQYAFAGGGSSAYRRHLEWITQTIQKTFPTDISILEVGCGDGWLIQKLHGLGFSDLLGIDPSRAAQQSNILVSGYFPHDLPSAAIDRSYDLIICRHVLEHIENPRAFAAEFGNALSDTGQIWIEVPDLDSTVDRGWWSNFYQLHCNYFTAITLDQLMAQSGFRCISGEIVDVFGGSLFRRYERGPSLEPPSPPRLTQISSRIDEFRTGLDQLAQNLPVGTVGYGAAERTAVTLGHSPNLMGRLTAVFDGNSLLVGRYLAGTDLRIQSKQTFFAQPPSAVLLFAISNAEEIIAEWLQNLPLELPVARVGIDSELRSLGSFR